MSAQMVNCDITSCKTRDPVIALQFSPSTSCPVVKSVVTAMGSWVHQLTKEEYTLQLRSNPNAKKVIFTNIGKLESSPAFYGTRTTVMNEN